MSQNKLAKVPTKYFDGMESIRALKTYSEVSIPPTSIKIDADHFEVIFKLCKSTIDKFGFTFQNNTEALDEIELLYKTIAAGIHPPSFAENSVTQIRIDIKGCKPFILKNPIVLSNLLNHSWPYLKPFIENEFHGYIKKHYVDRSKRKIKGGKTGKEKAIQTLSKQILDYLNAETDLQSKEKGNFIIEIFSSAGYKLEYTTGKNAYDAISRLTRVKKG